MNQKAFSLAAGVIFLLIALGHVLRIVLGWSLDGPILFRPDVGKRTRRRHPGLFCV